MADIFVSYATEDRERARSVAQALEARGWDVWWDREIPLGRLYDDAIEQALAAAGCAIVLWSKTSVASEWVRSEASEAKRRGILVPVFLDTIDPPLAFRLLQGADLTTWEPGSHHEEFEALAQRVSELLAQPRATARPIPERVTEGRHRQMRTGMGRWRWWASAAGLLALLVTGLSMAGVFRRTADTHDSVKPPAAHERSSRPNPADPTPSPPTKQAAVDSAHDDFSGLTSALQNALVSATGDQASLAALAFELKELAVKIMFVSDDQASTFKALGLSAGAVVIGVGPGPAQQAGLHAGDVLTSIGETPIRTADDLRQALRRVGPGKTRYGVRRSDRTLAIEIECPDCTNP